MLKTFCFSTSIFGGFGLHFGASGASKMEASWAQIRFFLILGAFLLRLKIHVFKKWRLGRLRARFWRPRGSILEGLGLIFQGFGRHKWSQERQETPIARESCAYSWHSWWPKVLLKISREFCASHCLIWWPQVLLKFSR